MTLDNFLKYEVDDFDADSSCIYLKLDKDKYDLPPMTLKSELKCWMLLKFLPLCGDGELSDLRVELEKNSKELEVYKKALIIACSQNNTTPICATEEYKDCCMSFGSCGECWANVCLQKARDINE